MTTTKLIIKNETKEKIPNHKIFPLALGALGVVYGDIGTSPLYALQQCFNGEFSTTLTNENVYGVLSLFFWSLTLVVTLKYLIFIMKADNHGEGGIFALLALTSEKKEQISGSIHTFVIFAALLGASLLYGDGMITPAISVLSAVEGLNVATTFAEHITVPITCVILFGLFYFQKYGTEKLGFIFGPVMVVWFFTIGILGLTYIFKVPGILAAVNPYYAYKFFIINHWHGFRVLGSVVLCITGAEALYADMGHFGKKPIRLSWFSLVFPALILNYFGQGALLLLDPSKVKNPFYNLVPGFLIYPMVILSTLATIIASQALISGAFSLTRQAIQLGFFPRLNIIHTSSKTEGQIYLPAINKLLMVSSIALVIAFKESSKLASAYGIAVTANMVLTSIVYFFVTTKTWKWPLWKALLAAGIFITLDITYLGSNLIKIMDGGWLPILVAAIILTIMLTWRDGRNLVKEIIKSERIPMELNPADSINLPTEQGTSHLAGHLEENSLAGVSLDSILGSITKAVIGRAPGTSVFMSLSLKGIPPVFINHLKHNHVLNKRVIFLSVKLLNVPIVDLKEKLEVKELGYGFFEVTAWYGFMQNPNVPEIIRALSDHGIDEDPKVITYYLGKQSILITGDTKMMKWRKSLFAFMSRNANSTTEYFYIPRNRVVELGMQLEI